MRASIVAVLALSLGSFAACRNDANLADLREVTLLAGPARADTGFLVSDIVQVNLAHPAAGEEDCPRIAAPTRAEMNGLAPTRFDPGSWQASHRQLDFDGGRSSAQHCFTPFFLWSLPAAGEGEDGDATFVIEDATLHIEAIAGALLAPRTLALAEGQATALRPGDMLELEYSPATDEIESFELADGSESVIEPDSLTAGDGRISLRIRALPGRAPSELGIAMTRIAPNPVCEGVFDCRTEVFAPPLSAVLEYRPE